MLGPMCERLQNEGYTKESEGALVVEIEGIDIPVMVRKSDGG